MCVLIALSDFKQQEEIVLEEKRAIFRKNMKDNNDISARKFMESDPHACRLVLQLAKKMNVKIKVKDEKGIVNAIRSQALARATTEELFIENRFVMVKEELIASFRAVEGDVAEISGCYDTLDSRGLEALARHERAAAGR